MKKGFTLIELLVVIAIIGILFTVIIASLSSSGDRENANYKIATDDGTYFVESYTKENQGQCVFMAEKEIRFCGNFTIEKLNKE